MSLLTHPLRASKMLSMAGEFQHKFWAIRVPFLTNGEMMSRIKGCGGTDCE